MREGMVKRKVPSPCSADDAYRTSGSGRRGEACVGGQKLAAEQLGQGDVAGVVGSDVVAQVVGAAHEGEGGVAVEVQELEVVDRGLEPACCEAAGKPAAAEHGDRLDIHQVGCGHLAS